MKLQLIETRTSYLRYGRNYFYAVKITLLEIYFFSMGTRSVWTDVRFIKLSCFIAKNVSDKGHFAAYFWVNVRILPYFLC